MFLHRMCEEGTSNQQGSALKALAKEYQSLQLEPIEGFQVSTFLSVQNFEPKTVFL